MFKTNNNTLNNDPPLLNEYFYSHWFKVTPIEGGVYGPSLIDYKLRSRVMIMIIVSLQLKRYASVITIVTGLILSILISQVQESKLQVIEKN